MRDFDKNKMMFLHMQAQIKEVEISEAAVREAVNLAIEKANQRNAEQASVDPVGPNQKPRMLQLTSWICHAGGPNLNGAAFLEQDLAEAVNEGLFQPPFFGMIDYNHDFNSYGVWFKAQYAFDPVAKQWGILAEGAIFAWRYEELADKLLAMQARQGHIDVSMACMPLSREVAKTDDGTSYVILRKPVFFTTSVLDVEPADPKARALGSESVEQTSEERVADLMAATIDGEATTTEEAMADTQETVEQVETTEQVQETAEVTEQVTEDVTEEATADTAEATETAEVAADAETTETAETQTEQTEATTESAVDEPTVASLQTEVQTLTVALNSATKTIADLTAERDALAAEKAEREAVEKAAKQAEVRAARLTEIPEAIREEMQSADNAALLDEWMNMDEAKWEGVKKVLAVASTAAPKSRADKSAEEGILSTASNAAEGEYQISRFVRRGSKR